MLGELTSWKPTLTCKVETGDPQSRLANSQQVVDSVITESSGFRIDSCLVNKVEKD